MASFKGLLLFSGVDRSGIAAGIFSTLSPFSVKIIDLEQILIGGRTIFAVLIELDPAHAEIIETELKVAAADLDLDFAAQFTDQIDTAAEFATAKVIIVGENFKPSLLFEIAEAITSFGANIDRMVRMVISGFDLGKMTDKDGNEFTIQVSKPHTTQPDLRVFDDLYVNNVQGAAIPLSQVAQLKLETSPQSISHLNKSRVVSVSSFVKKGFLNSDVITEVETSLNSIKLPLGYHFQMGGEVESRNDSFGGFETIILVTIFIFIAVLILEFGTFKSTLIVLSVIPLGIVGALLALYFTGNSMSFVATIGMIALAGIEVKNTILLVDFTNQLRREGMPMEEAIREAGEVRFLPIILTTFTAIGGLIPIAISTNPLISPLAIVMIGGLISSTLLSRIITPVVYKLIPPRV